MPGPPPGAIVPVGSTGPVVLVLVEVPAVGEVAGVGEAAIRRYHGRLPGLGDAATGDTAGVVVASVFLERFCLAGLGDAAAAVAAGDATFFFESLCLAVVGDVSGLGAGDGFWAAKVAAQNAVNAMIRPVRLFMPGE
jgi:hypothetical protein